MDYGDELSMSGAGEWDMRNTADLTPEDPMMGNGHIFGRVGWRSLWRKTDRSPRYPRGEKGIDSRVHMKEV